MKNGCQPKNVDGSRSRRVQLAAKHGGKRSPKACGRFGYRPCALAVAKVCRSAITGICPSAFAAKLRAAPSPMLGATLLRFRCRQARRCDRIHVTSPAQQRHAARRRAPAAPAILSVVIFASAMATRCSS